MTHQIINYIACPASTICEAHYCQKCGKPFIFTGQLKDICEKCDDRRKTPKKTGSS